jgi:CheY-like chemotaxis protein
LRAADRLHPRANFPAEYSDVGSSLQSSSGPAPAPLIMPSILVVDDDEMVRDAIASALKRAGYSVLEAADGREAATRFKSQPVDLVITDILMPERDGLETIQSLNHGPDPVPIIAMTGLSSRSSLYLEMARTFGAVRVLEKPFELTELIQVTRELLAAK